MELKPGRELDALVAEKVMGWRKTEIAFHGSILISPCGSLGIPENDEIKLALPRYSASIEASWEVADKIMIESIIKTEKGYVAKVVGKYYTGESAWPRVNEYYETSLYEDSIIIGETIPHAICLAALEAVGYDYKT